MTKEIAVIAVHGMGDTKRNFADGLEERLNDNLGVRKWGKVYFSTVFYQDLFQENENVVFREMKKKEIDYIKLRKLLLYGLADAAGMERKANLPNSPYVKIQEIIRDALDEAFVALGQVKKPVIIVAHSLGCQVISNYIWDCQKTKPLQGIWKSKKTSGKPEDNFRRLKSLKAFYTTGCNIPLFVAGLPQSKITAFTTQGKGYDFLWHNYYDEDDVLGWPMKPLSPSFKKAVYRDHEINANGGFIGNFTRGWNPLSHGGYWIDRDFIRPLSKAISKFV